MKRIISILSLILCMMIVFAACAANTDTPEGSETTSDTVGSETTTDTTKEEEDTEPQEQPEEPKKIVIKIYNSGQLLSLLENSKSENYAESSKNMIYQLQTDIDLNEGWSAELLADGDTVTAAPKAPNTVWEGISRFYGTLDGNGKTIRGIYMSKAIDSATSMGFIGELCGGTIKDLTIDNSYIEADVTAGTQNVYVGGLVGSVTEASVIENVTVKTNLLVTGESSALASVTVGYAANGILTESELKAEGTAFRKYNDVSIIKVSTAGELLTALNTYGDFEGKTLKLMADIDLNPGWSANVTEEGTVVFPTAPETLWPDIAYFKGVFDGNGYTLSGIYKSMTVVKDGSNTGGFGAYGGLFNVLDGGSVKNLRISNSFIYAYNSYWGSGKVHVGGIAGEANTGSDIYNIYMDSTVEIWYQCDGHAELAGAIAHANGSFTLKGFVFMGVIGNTSLSNDVNYACPSDKPIWIATVVANSNGQSCTVLNGLALKECIHSGKIYNGNNDRMGLWDDTTKASGLANTRESAEWLLTRPDNYGKTHVWSETLQAICPKECYELVEGNFVHSTN